MKQGRIRIPILFFGMTYLLAIGGRSWPVPGKENFTGNIFCSGWKMQGAVKTGDIILLTQKGTRILSESVMKNFSISMEVRTTPGAEGYLAFHMHEAQTPARQGYRVMINNSDYRMGSPQKSGSLCLIRNNFVRTAEDGSWFTLQVSVEANKIRTFINDKPVAEYVEPATPFRIKGLEGMILSRGIIALEKTTDKGSIEVKEIRINTLSDNLPRVTPDSLTADETGQALTLLNEQGFPLIDYHAHLKGGLTVDQVMYHGRICGYNYGISPNCGLHFPVTNDSTLLAYYNNMAPEPVFKAMQCEGREWVTLFTPPVISKFDYIFTDAMTWTDNKGRRMRLWIPEETFVEDEQQFMDMLVAKIEAILYHEPVDIHVNPTYLPDAIAADYDKLWTPERMDRVIKALKDNDVALEINARFRIPSITFLKKAKAAGVKFTFGTNNAGNTDLNRLEYCLKAVREVGLTPDDMFLPRPAGQKKVQKMGLPSKITG